MTPSAPAWPAGVGRRDLDDVDSTNAEARRRAAAGDVGPLWISARVQTAGRGRRGRAWRSHADDLKATLLLRPAALRPGVSMSQTATLSFVAGLAVSDLARAVAPTADIALKWPNDVLVEGRKLAGILIEAESDWAAIGIGVNLVSAPPPDMLEARALTPIALGEVAEPISADEALVLLAVAVARRLDDWSDGGFAPIRRAWLERAARLGETIEVRGGGEVLKGRFADVDQTGALVLETSDGVRRIAAADVFLP